MGRRAHASRALRVAALRYRFRESLFRLPSLVIAGGVALALVAAEIDRSVGDDGSVPLTLDMSSNAATWLLATAAGAMITTVGVVLSLTVVSLQLASSQFSPLVMRSFIRDRSSQLVIGLLVATFFYCVLTLPNVSGSPEDPAPRVSLTVAVVLTLVTVVAIIAHLDRLARRLQVGHVVRAIVEEDEAVVARLRHAGAGARPLRSTPPAELAPPAVAAVVAGRTSGWVSQVDHDRLLASVPPRTTVRLETRIGAYLHAGEPLLTCWPPVPEELEPRLLGAVEVSDTRTMQQDVDFAIRQLVDIGLRALGTAINDPTTAVEVTLRLGSLLRHLLTTPVPPPALEGADGRVLVRPWDLDHDEYVEHAFDQLRRAAPAEPQVAAALLRVLRMLVVHVEAAGFPERVPALRRQLQLLLDELEDAPLHPADLAWLRAVSSDATDPADHSRHG